MISDGRIPSRIVLRIGEPNTGRFGKGKLIRIRKSDLDEWIGSQQSKC